MNQAEFFQDFAALPPEAQKIVADLITLLSKQNERTKPIRKMKSTRLVDEKFIGIWQDRDEMNDSTAYVRDLRKHGWI
ncbi:MAG: DUF2281 domain-containing protein [Chloroflexi bacterium]|nr:DUF2281 domain-containing protein [Chloroflexota bacterium]